MRTEPLAAKTTTITSGDQEKRVILTPEDQAIGLFRSFCGERMSELCVHTLGQGKGLDSPFRVVHGRLFPY
jgi:hypothetical protein